jgi:L-malate glycosyltransferase
MVAEANRRFIVPAGDESALGEALITLASDAGLRAEIGAANRKLAVENYDEVRMIATYRALYASAMGLPDLP